MGTEPDGVIATAPADTGGETAEDRFQAALDVPLTEPRLRAIERAGALSDAALDRAVQIACGSPPAPAWRRFALRMLLLAGAAHVVVGVVRVLVETWDDLGRIGAVVLTVGVALAPAGAALWIGPGRTAARVCLAATALLVACVPAVVGTVYDLGGEAWQSLAIWTVLALPFALAARSGAVWIVPLAALHLTAFTLVESAAGSSDAAPFLVTAGVGAAAWIGWTFLAQGRAWMRARTVPRVEGVVTVLAVTCVAVLWTVDEADLPEGLLATTLLLAATARLVTALHRGRGDVVLAVVALLACATTAAIGVSRGIESVADWELALTAGGLLFLATSGAILVWTRSVLAREATP